MAPPSKAPTSLRPPQLPKSSSSWLHCVGIGEHLLFSRRRCSTTPFAESEPRCPSYQGESQVSHPKELNMGLLDVLNGMQNGPRGQPQPSAPGSGGMSKTTMALLAFLAYKAFKGMHQPQAQAGVPSPNRG